MDKPSELALTEAEQQLLDKFERRVASSLPSIALAQVLLLHLPPLQVLPPLPTRCLLVHCRSPNLLAFCSYDDYLASFVTKADLKYLQSEETARRVVELG